MIKTARVAPASLLANTRQLMRAARQMIEQRWVPCPPLCVGMCECSCKHGHSEQWPWYPVVH